MIVPSDDDREGEQELEILQRFSSDQYAANPANHTVQCLESFPMPGVDGGVFCVMPLLRGYDDPPFDNLGEIQEFLTQIFEVAYKLHYKSVFHDREVFVGTSVSSQEQYHSLVRFGFPHLISYRLMQIVQ